MVEITNVLFWISTGLLIPVVVILLVIFIRALILTGGFVGLFIGRLKFQKEWQKALMVFKQDQSKTKVFTGMKGNQAFSTSLLNLLNTTDRKVIAEKILYDFEIASDKELAKVKSISKLGPMLGLMGTLIPMGPALVGLAAGDIASMAQNMQVAFSTTVVGLFAGALAYVLQLNKQRWLVEDLNNLEFVFSLLFEEEKRASNLKKDTHYEEEKTFVEQ